MIHVTTTDSATGIPPNTGIVNAVSQLSSSISAFDNSSVFSLPFFPTLRCILFKIFPLVNFLSKPAFLFLFWQFYTNSINGFCKFFYVFGIEYFICLDLFYFYPELIPKYSPKYPKKSTFLFSYLLRFLNKMHFTLFSNIYHNSIMNFDYYK